MKVDIFDLDKKYNIIYADPPWRYKDSRCGGACERHYSTMKIDEIKALPIKDIADDNCILFLWTTYPMYADALELIESWGFKYKTIGVQWIKLYKRSYEKNIFFMDLKEMLHKISFFGLGRWTRGNTEPCIIATKGKPKRLSASVSQLIYSPIQEHSKKPDETRERIVDLVGDLPRIELFARQEADGWDCWGNEV